MLNRLPRSVPDLQTLLDDLAVTTADMPKLARALGVSERTVWRWKAKKAPRMALLALWWLSREGHSHWDCEAARLTRDALAYNAALKAEVARLQRLIRLDGAITAGLVGRLHDAANHPHMPAAWSRRGVRPAPNPCQLVTWSANEASEERHY